MKKHFLPSFQPRTYRHLLLIIVPIAQSQVIASPFSLYAAERCTNRENEPLLKLNKLVEGRENIFEHGAASAC